MEAAIPRPIGPYSRPDVLANLDRRTRESRLVEKTRADLIAHVGGTPSATQRALIERAVQLTIRLALMDQDFAQKATQTDHDSRTYLAWTSCLNRTLRQLGPAAKAAKPDLASYVASRASQVAA